MAYYCITGTPGTGKKTIARAVAPMLGLEPLNINELLRDNGFREEIELKKARKLIAGKIPGNSLVYGHLVPYILRPDEVKKIVVLRCDPLVLKKRLEQRGYSKEKLIQNLEAELIGVIANDTHSRINQGKVHEFDNTNVDIHSASLGVYRLMRSRKKGERIDWLEDYSREERFRLLFS